VLTSRLADISRSLARNLGTQHTYMLPSHFEEVQLYLHEVYTQAR
jgi:hypothetical protein